MLQLKAIKKDYKAGDTVVHALKGVDISFRKSEFVSVLGPSGCGKTTLLNIIGGLDHYSDGELYIDGVSTESSSVSAANQTYRALFEKVVENDDTGELAKFENFAGYFSLVTESFMQAPDNTDFILSQYDILSDPETSKIATEADEIMIVVNDDTALSDLLLAQFGYYSQEEFFNIIFKAIKNDNYDEALWKERFGYEDLMSKTFT